MRSFDLSYNFLCGELPPSPLSTNIWKLDLSNNRFHGAITSSFFQQSSNLITFNVSNNAFSGVIPSSSIWPQHSSPLIKLLDFSNNKFNGSISRGLGECSKLQAFRAGNNNLSGVLPNDIFKATKLEEIYLPSNLLYGAISDRIANLTNLEILDLSHNQLSGELSVYFGRLSKLKLMHLEFTNLKGHLPQPLKKCTRLIEVHLTVNDLEGDISALDFSTLNHLTKLGLRRNIFTGNFPISLYSCKSLEAIRLSRNELEEQIQPEILSLKSLSFLSPGYTRLTNVTGTIKIIMHFETLFILLPSSFKGEKMPSDGGSIDFHGIENLQYLDLSYCELSGEIPAWLLKLKNLEVLHLGVNRMTGLIPIWLGALPKLFRISLANNLLSGEFPKKLCGLSSLVNATQLVDHYALELPVFAKPVKSIHHRWRRLSNFPPLIDLSYNNITGNIPTEIGQLKLLHLLYLTDNHFSGNIPDQLFNLKNLEKLDVSKNHFSGNIPWSVTSLNFLNYFNVSYNNLEGAIPIGSQLQSFDASLFKENKLCGLPLPNKCQSSTVGDEDIVENNELHHQLPWFYIFVALGFIVGFLGVCDSLIINRTWRYAYFRFTDNVQDRLYVMTTVRIISMRRWQIRG